VTAALRRPAPVSVVQLAPPPAASPSPLLAAVAWLAASAGSGPAAAARVAAALIFLDLLAQTGVDGGDELLCHHAAGLLRGRGGSSWTPPGVEIGDIAVLYDRSSPPGITAATWENTTGNVTP
jgi:hypothetical protein